ncbi:Protein of unknown function [Alteribacillus persepolensis]|uniref:DUF2759 domain-containing protein n=1 Tax=Alteribacillus persepolensis TaxID=568899 RepID=A0A1G8CXV7_9BACI|nr:DUF2759 domain-containing protein [Alteribacillus persepolensis]SDH50204.1 Protein of unknown function [Alteribacillus persepolensis]
MAFGIMMLFVAILCAIAVIREVKERNFLAVGFAGISFLVFGWFSVMTIFVSGAPEM